MEGEGRVRSVKVHGRGDWTVHPFATGEWLRGGHRANSNEGSAHARLDIFRVEELAAHFAGILERCEIIRSPDPVLRRLEMQMVRVVVAREGKWVIPQTSAFS